MPQSYSTAQKLLPLLLDSLQDYALFMMDAEGQILTWTPGVLRLLGYEESEFVGQAGALIFTPQDQAKGVPEDERENAVQRGRTEDVRWHQRKDGSLFWANGQMIALRGEDGLLRGFAKILRDDTPRKQAEEAMQLAHARSEEAHRIKDEFLSILSHELRSPLSAILGWAHILRTHELDSSTQQQGLEAIERSANAQTRLINDLLDVSRILTGKLHLEPRPVELAEIVTDAVNTIKPSAQVKQIHVETRPKRLSSLAPGLISGDINRLTQVFWNLLSNAIKFTPPRGHILVSMRQEETHVEVEIEDTGKGITAEFLPHVFERFRQADSSSTRAHGGLGLGLALVRELVEAQGGTVSAQSPGEDLGSTFTLTFPLLAAQPLSHPAEPSQVFSARPQTTQEIKQENRQEDMLDESTESLADLSLAGLTILVVDDEPDIRNLLGLTLEQWGAQVETVEDAPGAFDCVVQRYLEGTTQTSGQRFDVLVSDIGMPTADGYNLIGRIRSWEAAHGGFLPAIALTAYADPKSRMKSLLAGFQVHLTKPMDMEELVVTIASLSGRTGGQASDNH